MGPIWRLLRKMEIPAVHGPVAAFCGVARPEQFFAGLEDCRPALCRPNCVSRVTTRYTAGDLNRRSTTVANGSKDREPRPFSRPKRTSSGWASSRLIFPESLPLKLLGLRIEIEDEDQAIEWVTARIGDGLRPAPTHQAL